MTSSRRTTPPALGVFVTGTDTDVGKTLISAILAKAWAADYWKPFQTGMATACDDTATVTALLGAGSRQYPPACALQAPLAPWAAARLEGITLDVTGIRLPHTTQPLVVEGAGGLLVPIDEKHMMIDLAARLALPVVLVARSTLGTINHTLLSLQALAARDLPVLGVVMNGPLSPGNRQALEHFGQTPILAEIPWLDAVNPRTVAEAASRVTPLQAALIQAGLAWRSQPGIHK
ncbi:dethiobiotin synthase [Castellaniella sp. MT123]|uniref:dethiobiotin synthase n=1 Tax=Castellaniella sp. MT123 TaxID=3140381 RepID=UPI0031F4356A